MVRQYKTKHGRKVTTPTKLTAAVTSVLAGWSYRKAATHYGLNRQTLFTAVKKTKGGKPVGMSAKLSYCSRKVIPDELEQQIAEYCIQICQMGYGLTVLACRELTYEVAKKNNLKVPANWNTNKQAGIDWFHGFTKRHPEISIRTPEACSVARASAFNETNVKIFYDKLDAVLDRHTSFRDGSRCYNLDETNTSTVQNMHKIISPKGVKQVHNMKGAERGVGVTTCVIISAHGALLPPVHIFPRKKFVPDLLLNCYPGALGLGNEKGYMTKETFVKVMVHFIKCTASSVENPTLLMLDNVDTHFSSQTLDLAKEFGVTVFTFPPHCTHKLQPLDVGFFSPFKTAYDNAVSTFMRNNPAKPPTIYRIAGFCKEALFKAATPQTIIKSFENPGIIPFKRDVFTEVDFIMAKVTENENPSTEEPVLADPPPATSAEIIDVAVLAEVHLLDGCEKEDTSACSETSSTSSFLGPAEIRGFPKAKQTEKKRNRRKGKCMVATDTPEKNEIVAREAEQTAKKKKTEENKKKRLLKEAAGENDKQRQGGKKKKADLKKSTMIRVLDFDSIASEQADDVEAVSQQVHDKVLPNPESFAPLNKPPIEGDYVLVAFKPKNTDRPSTYFVGKIISEIDSENDLQISYLRKKVNRNKSISFTVPSVPDLKSVHVDDVKVILPKPTYDAGTRRQQSLIIFNFNFAPLKLG